MGVSTSAFFNDREVAVSYEKAGNIMISGLALQVSYRPLLPVGEFGLPR